MFTDKNILILGGMGPQASLLLHKKLLQLAVLNGAKQASDFPAITHLSMPHKDFINDPDQKLQALDTIKNHLYCLWECKVFSRRHCLQHCTSAC